MKKYILGLLSIFLLTNCLYGAMDFEYDDDGDRVEFGNVDLSSGDTASFCLWFIRESNDSTDPRILSSSYGISYDQNWVILLNEDATPSDFVGRLRTTSGQDILREDDVIYDDVLYFACMTYDGSNIRLYLDGVEVDSSAQTGNITNTSSPDTIIGTDGDQITSREFDGIIDDVRIYDRALSATEVSTIYYSRGVDNITYGLLHRWLLNEQSPGTTASGSNTVKDMIGQNHGTPQVSPVYTDSKLKFRRNVK